MRIAIFSDVHGNLQALDAVLADVRAQHADAIYCLGDLVGYGANPDEVTALVRGAGYPTVMGNYDEGVGFEREDCGCAYRDPAERERGLRSLEWTKGRVSSGSKAFLRSLAKELRFESDGRRHLLVHGSPRRINEYLFADRPLSSFERLAAASAADVIVFGHTHQPYVKDVSGVRFINAGSVGKPKDGDWRACYLVLTAGEPIFRRVEYDVEGAAAAIRAAGLPEEFAVDLAQRSKEPGPIA